MKAYLTQQRNMCMPIGRLSVEIVVEILEYCLEQGLDRCTPRIIYPSAFFWCKTWRTIAINTPSLWSQIFLPAPRKMFRLLRDRSGTASLTVFVLASKHTLKDSELTWVGNALCEIIPRISHLTLEWSLHKSSGILREFLLAYVGQKQFDRLRFLEWDVMLHEPSSEIFTLNAPEVRSLKVNGEMFRALRLPCPHVVRLQLILDDVYMSSEEILGLLSEVPYLEHCEISDPEPISGPLTTNSRPLVLLSNLRYLAIGAVTIRHAGYLLQHLEIPSSAKVQLEIWSDDSEGESEDVPHFVSLKSVLPTSMAPFLGLGMTFTGVNSCFTFTTESEGSLALDCQFDNLAQLFSEPSDLASYAAILTEVEVQYMPFTLPATRHLINAFLLWSRITQLRVQLDENDFERLLTALEDTPEIVCPRLRILDCGDTKLSSARMVVFLGFRRDKGVPITELTVSRRCIEGDVNDLSPLVTKLVITDLDP
ncbi:hypothetical protein SISNIDRAFT_452601 [Sistotremastrum niveocremeum HHB9708]|uniref:F-box domain-containing protein n=1 Tax=Sistotremastrum niveocremeum HHB9708 TaxID=1314777 RepID=A0A164WPT4_9AGAM|nr:hypothetical protein SISNIDRAFT_452601 [Sistotremastrum niveocremeum HHB9708]